MNQSPYHWTESAFDLVGERMLRGDDEGDHWLWLGRHAAEGSYCHFGLYLCFTQPKGSLPVTFTKGELCRGSGSDPSAFLRSLAHDFGVSEEVKATDLVDVLPFSAAIMGRGLTLGTTGNFVVQGRFTTANDGDWTVLKLFLGPDEDEVFLDLNRRLGKAQFTLKEPNGDRILAELARVLLPKPPANC